MREQKPLEHKPPEAPARAPRAARTRGTAWPLARAKAPLVRLQSASGTAYARGCGASSRPLACADSAGTALLSPRMLIRRCMKPVTPWLGRRGTAMAAAISRSAALPAATQFSPAARPAHAVRPGGRRL